MFPHTSSFLVECYNEATSTQFGYLFLDFKQNTDNDMRVQTRILPTETIYLEDEARMRIFAAY